VAVCGSLFLVFVLKKHVDITRQYQVCFRMICLFGVGVVVVQETQPNFGLFFQHDGAGRVELEAAQPRC
jgi:hypothetical protein